jgi:hypothetical protein
MKHTVRSMRLAGIVLLLIAAACSDDDKSITAPEPSGVAALRASLEPYSSFALAKSAGYATAITDCMSNGDVGAMGVHYANTTLLDATADSLHPEALIYEPGTNGDASLVGVEFIVPYTALARSATPPRLFGQAFSQNDVFGVWALHVWTHRTNPSGTFAPWNPRVHC